MWRDGGKQEAKGSEEMGGEDKGERGNSTHGGPCLDFASESKGDDKPLESWYPLKKKGGGVTVF